MVIQCSACQTRYRLAEDKIKPQGSKVRCSKCGEVFIVLPSAPAPALPPSEPAIEDFAAPANGAVTGQASADTSSTGGDYHDWSDFDLPGNDSGPAPAVAEDNFEEFPATDPTETAAAGEFREEELRSAAGNEDNFSFKAPARAPDADEFTFGEESTEGEEEVTFEEELGDEDDFAIGEAGTDRRAVDLFPLEFDTLAFDEPPSENGATDGDLAAGLGAGVSDELSFEEDDEPSFASANSEADEDAFSWGDPDDAAAFPDDFDFGDASESHGGADTDDLDFDSPGLAAQESSPASVRAKRTAAPATKKPPEAEQPLTAEPLLPVDRRKYARHRRKGGTSLLTWLVALILLGLCAATGYFYWLGEFPDVNGLLNRFMPPGTTAPAVSKIKVGEVNGFFVNNTEAGQLFVVQGQAVNGYPEPRSAMAVQGKLFNRAGSLLRERSAYCGNSLSESELKSLPLAKLRERSENQFGDSLSNLNVAPGKSVPFTIVFSSLPSDLAEFTVEPGDSIPGSKQ
jgi:predicted Zn finger-like uncharacterized protein